MTRGVEVRIQVSNARKNMMGYEVGQLVDMRGVGRFIIHAFEPSSDPEWDGVTLVLRKPGRADG